MSRFSELLSALIARYQHGINKVNLTTTTTLTGAPLGSPPTGVQASLYCSTRYSVRLACRVGTVVAAK